jgi:shikimate dehydrogenase
LISTSTTVCGVIGNPVAHSMSPTVHQAGYRALGLDFSYLAFKVTDLPAALRGMRGLGLRGFSVTLPYKKDATDLIDEADASVKETGALNTIVNENGKLKGYDTDGAAALSALCKHTAIEGKQTVVIGAGGTALSIAHSLKKAGARLTILNRNVDKAAALAADLNAAHGNLEQLDLVASAEIIVHATPVGMWPDVDATPLPEAPFHSGQTILDAVYNPSETRLLAEARAAGASVVPGHRMFLHQAAAQFQLFTGHEAPLEAMDYALLTAFKGDANA